MLLALPLSSGTLIGVKYALKTIGVSNTLVLLSLYFIIVRLGLQIGGARPTVATSAAITAVVTYILLALAGIKNIWIQHLLIGGSIIAVLALARALEL